MTAREPASGATRALLLVSLAVLTGTGPWLVGSAIGPALLREWRVEEAALSPLTVAVQLGFVAGTFGYALSNVADLFDPRRVLFVSSLLAAAANLGFAEFATGVGAAVPFRFLTGFFLAGVYPVGMKIVSTWTAGRLGAALGIMVGALTLGTASPWLLRGLLVDHPWQRTVQIASALATLGALLTLRLGPAPFEAPRARFDLRRAFVVFRDPPFRWAALGYFGHMWELYAVWNWIGAALIARQLPSLGAERVPYAVFGFVALGAAGCALGGRWSRVRGERLVAERALWTSAACCVGYALCPDQLVLLVPLLALWGLGVVADSPQFSALSARFAPADSRGTALTVQNGIGFAISVVSLQVLPRIAATTGWRYAFLALLPGPLFGAYAMRRLGRLTAKDPGPAPPSPPGPPAPEPRG